MVGRRNWLIVFNCTNIGLANSLKLQAPDLDVESIDFGRFRKDFGAYASRLAKFDLIVTAPHFVRNDCVDFSGVTRVRTLVDRKDHLILSFFRAQGMVAGPSLQLDMDVS